MDIDIKALERLLIEKGIIKENELHEMVLKLVKEDNKKRESYLYNSH